MTTTRANGSVSISDIPEYLKTAYAASLPALLRSPHGIGKSTIFKETASEMGIECRTLDLSLMEPVDLSGLPSIINNQTQYAPPSILPSEGKGFLLLEELNRATTLTRAPALNLLTNRCLNEYELPSGWLPCQTCGDYWVGRW